MTDAELDQLRTLVTRPIAQLTIADVALIVRLFRDHEDAVIEAFPDLAALLDT